MAKKKTTKSVSQKKQIEIPIELQGIFYIAISLLLLLSLLSFSYHEHSQNWIGIVGDSIGWLLHVLFGVASFATPAFFAWLGICKLTHKEYSLKKAASFTLLLMFSLGMLLSVIEHLYPNINKSLHHFFYTNQWSSKQRFHLGGALQFYLYKDLQTFNLNRIIGSLGVTVFFSCTLIASCLVIFNISIEKLFLFTANLFSKIKNIKLNLPKFKTAEKPLLAAEEPTKVDKKVDESDSDFMRYVKLRTPNSPLTSTQVENKSFLEDELLQIEPEKNLIDRPSLSKKEKIKTEIVEEPKFEPIEKKIAKTPPPVTKNAKREAALIAQSVHNGDFSAYAIPEANLLTSAKKFDESSLKSNLKKQAEVLEETLQSFGIEATVGQINCGPTITSFEVHPAIGVKVQRIKSLENDIALNMEAKSIRIIAPIPGRAAVGIEVPNASPQEVSFKDMLQHYSQSNKKFHIPVLLGKAVNGDYVMSDLTKMPHCIIAGATGSGKSVCINTIVMSILLNAKPDEIKLIMVDPKKVELTPYTNLPHMLAPVITEPHGACAALRWMVKEMEKRYEILKQIGVRNIDSFNNRKIDKDLEASLSIEVPEKMPYIVGIIDELADLMMVASNDIETPIARIAQMARAVGIHLVLATQRPSREVITGLIKANFPTRISFKVASRVNSQIVLDEVGAESLLGNGDMLFLPPGSSHLVRAQGAFIRDEDINQVVKHICDQAPPNYVIPSFDSMLSAFAIDDGKAIGSNKRALDSQDELYSDAHDIVLSTGNASTTFLQRKLKIGYARAASLMDELEANGIVSPAEGSKPRKILAGKKQESSDKKNDDSFDLFDEPMVESLEMENDL